MSTVNLPFGLRVANHTDGIVTFAEYKIDPASPVIQTGQPVALSAGGYLTAAVAGPGNRIVGIFGGCKYVDGDGRPQVNKQWPALTLATNVVGYVNESPDLVYEVQATGPVPFSMIGSQGQLVNAGTVNSLGFSQGALDIATLSPSVGNQFMIVGVMKDEDNDWGDAFTIVRVRASQHQFAADILPF